jgi:hypothetical protein
MKTVKALKTSLNFLFPKKPAKTEARSLRLPEFARNIK